MVLRALKAIILAPVNFVKYFVIGILSILLAAYTVLVYVFRGVLNFFKHVLMGLYAIFLAIYYFFRDVVLGIFTIFHIIYKIFVGFFKYVYYGLLAPTYFISNFIGKIYVECVKRSEKRKLKNRLKKEEKERIRALKEAKKLEEKQALIDKKKNSEKDKDKLFYKNEDVVIEKKTFGDKINDAIESFLGIPKRFINKIKDSYHNSSFVKQARNEKDLNRQAMLINFEGADAVKAEKKIMWEYTGKSAEGKYVKGYFEAYSKVEVHSFLLSEGMTVYSIRTSKWIELLHGNVGGNGVKMKNKDLIFFLTQLSTYIKSGIPLVEALNVLTRQFKQKSYQRMFRSMMYDLTMGENFSKALEKQGNSFPPILINMVKASELTGELPEALDDMANYFSEAEAAHKEMVSALTYPTMVFIMAIGVSIFVLIYVVPKFGDMYASMDSSKIPGFTIFVMNTSAFLKSNIIWILLILVFIVLLIRYLYKNVKIMRAMMQWVMMHIPIVGNIIIYNEVTMFTKTFCSLLSHNVFITDSMEILNKITNNEIYKMMILDTITNLARGEKISAAFKDHWAFPIPAYEMIVTGEKTGQLAEMMGKVSTYYQGLHKNTVSRVKSLMEPLIIVFLTVVVGAIVLAVVIPMFSMYQTVQNY